MPDLTSIAVIIPSLNEAQSLRELLPLLQQMQPGQVLVCDNGSTDDTRQIVEQAGENWIYEPRRGYGAACFAGMRALADDVKVVVFLDADLSDDPMLIVDLCAPILDDTYDFVVGARVPQLRQPGSMTFPQRFANAMFPVIIKMGWGYAYSDLGPFRAIRRSSLDAIDMQDRAYGWTIEMQIRAVELGLRIREFPVSYRKRPRGPSKISGTIRGVFLAAYWITRTCGGLWLTRHRRIKKASINPTPSQPG